jgi:hypothetical protein
VIEHHEPTKAASSAEASRTKYLQKSRILANIWWGCKAIIRISKFSHPTQLSWSKPTISYRLKQLACRLQWPTFKFCHSITYTCNPNPVTSFDPTRVLEKGENSVSLNTFAPCFLRSLDLFYKSRPFLFSFANYPCSVVPLIIQAFQTFQAVLVSSKPGDGKSTM